MLDQPAKGFRAGLDSVLLGAAVSPQSSRLLDLGSGVGAASLAALAHNERLSAVLVEKNGEHAGLAARNVQENGFADRAQVLELDLTAPGRTRSAAGLKSDHFTSVIANPPYFDAAGGTLAPEGGRAAARHMHAPELDKWVRTAATSAAPRGEIIFIYRADGLAELLAALAARFGGLTVLPVVPREGEAASRVLVRGLKGSRAPLTLRSPLVLHGPSGNAFRPGVDSIFRGSATLDW